MILLLPLKYLQAYYGSLPPSIAKFSPSERDVVVYTGYGMTKSIQFYDLESKAVTRSIPLTHWARSMDVSPQGSLIAIGTDGQSPATSTPSEGDNHWKYALKPNCVGCICALASSKTFAFVQFLRSWFSLSLI